MENPQGPKGFIPVWTQGNRTEGLKVIDISASLAAAIFVRGLYLIAAGVVTPATNTSKVSGGIIELYDPDGLPVFRVGASPGAGYKALVTTAAGQKFRTLLDTSATWTAPILGQAFDSTSETAGTTDKGSTRVLTGAAGSTNQFTVNSVSNRIPNDTTASGSATGQWEQVIVTITASELTQA